MKTRFTIWIACTLLVAGLACAQPQVPNPEAPQVPGVTSGGEVGNPPEPEVGNPVEPNVPNAGGPPAAVANSCACPATPCANGDVPSCQVSCSGQEIPECSCNGFCDDDGNPKGVNRCRCQ
jgi:hypothetical protein